ncbi:MAG: endolytic transglycosylase MltG, partial [Oscillospiraceae bacterium]
MNDNRNSGNRPRDSRGNRNADDFELNISDEMFNTTPDIPLAGIDATQSFSTSRKTMEGSSTNAYYADNEQKKNKKEHKKRDKIKGIKNRRVFRVVWWAMVILVSLTFASYLITGSNDFLAVGHQEGVAQITIPKDVTVDQLTDILSKGGVIKSPEFFKIYCSVTTKMGFFDPGSFEVATNLDYEAIINTLQAGKPLGEEVKITFPEGVNIQQIAALLEENGVCTAQEALDAAKTVNFDEYDMIGAVKNGDKKYYKLE